MKPGREPSPGAPHHPSAFQAQHLLMRLQVTEAEGLPPSGLWNELEQKQSWTDGEEDTMQDPGHLAGGCPSA